MVIRCWRASFVDVATSISTIPTVTIVSNTFSLSTHRLRFSNDTVAAYPGRSARERRSLAANISSQALQFSRPRIVSFLRPRPRSRISRSASSKNFRNKRDKNDAASAVEYPLGVVLIVRSSQLPAALSEYSSPAATSTPVAFQNWSAPIEDVSNCRAEGVSFTCIQQSVLVAGVEFDILVRHPIAAFVDETSGDGRSGQRALLANGSCPQRRGRYRRALHEHGHGVDGTIAVEPRPATSWIPTSHTDGMLMTSSRCSEPTSGVA